MSTRPVVSRRDLLTLGQRSALETRSASQSLVHIASLLVRTLPDRTEEVCITAASIAGAEVHPTPQPGKLVIALECADERVVADCLNALHAIPGVLTVAVISHVIEDAEALAEEMIDASEST